jgi:excisionase family DNA binding protein
MIPQTARKLFFPSWQSYKRAYVTPESASIAHISQESSMNTSFQEVEFRHRKFSVDEAAEHLRISRAHLFKLFKNGTIKPFKLGNRTIITGEEILRVSAS